MQGVILAAGKGTRLKPITLTRTKAMAPILGKPIVERVMEGLAENGVKDFILVVSPEDKEIVHYFQTESTLDVAIQFVAQKTRRGMGDALRYALPFVVGDFVLSACDNLVDKSYINRMLSFWNASENPDAVLTLMEVPPERIPHVGIVDTEGDRIKAIIEKPTVEEAPSNIASLPLYCFSKRLLKHVPQIPLSKRDEYELQDAIQMLIEESNNVYGLQLDRRMTVTRPTDLLAINIHYLKNDKNQTQIKTSNIGHNTEFVTPLVIDTNVKIGNNCKIGPNVYIEKGAQIGNHVNIRDSIVLQNSVVGDEMTIEGQVYFKD